jgi:hypothetical protein
LKLLLDFPCRLNAVKSAMHRARKTTALSLPPAR